MQWHGLKLSIVCLAFVGGLALAFGGQIVYKEFIFQQPLNKVLADNKMVEEYVIENNANQSVIKIKLSNEASNLMTAYQEINGLTSKVMGTTPYVLEIVSKPDKVLDNAFYDSHHVIYQAQVSGNFPEVAKKVEEASIKYGVDGKVYIDQDNIYIQLKNTNGHYLNKVVPRQNIDQSVTLQGGGQVAKGN